jgi:hypothetical protein
LIKPAAIRFFYERQGVRNTPNVRRFFALYIVGCRITVITKAKSRTTAIGIGRKGTRNDPSRISLVSRTMY